MSPQNSAPKRSRSKLLSWLDRQIIRSGLISSRAIRWQIVVFLHFTRIDRIVVSEYERRTMEHQTSSNGHLYAKFPHMPSFFHRYELFGTLYMIPCLIKYTFPTQVNQLLVSLYDTTGDGKLAGLPAECMIPGRILNIHVLRNQFGVIASSFNLFYRLWMWRQSNARRRALSFCLIDTLVQDEKAVESFYKDHNQTKYPFGQFMCFIGGWSGGGGGGGRRTGGGGGGGDRERLRENLSPEECRKFRLYFAYATLIGAYTMVWHLLVICPIFMLIMLSDRGYLYQYPGCDQHLELLHATQALPWFSMTLTPHRCVMIVFDLLENLFMWVDTIVTFLAFFSLLLILNQHVLTGWRLMHEKIWCALVAARREHHLAAATETTKNIHGMPQPPTPPPAWIINCRRPRPQIIAERATSTELSGHILDELQPEIRDFFRQVSDMNLLASDLLTVTVLFWLAFLPILVHKSLAHYLIHPDFLSYAGYTYPQLLLVAVLITFIPTTLVSFTMFRVHPCCLKTYQLLGSLIAYNRLNGEKRQFANELMEYYQHQNKICYKILNTYPFKATTFFTLVGWTLTALSLLANMVGGRDGGV